MQEDVDVSVAVLSSRPSLDLAINIWMPGYVAHSAKDLDAVMDLTDDAGVIVIDLGDPDGLDVLRALHERRTGTPTVVVNVGDRQLDPDIAGVVVVADSTTVAGLTSAIDSALGASSRPVAEEPAPDARSEDASLLPRVADDDPRRPPAEDATAAVAPGAVGSNDEPLIVAGERPRRSRRQPAQTRWKRGRWSFGGARMGRLQGAEPPDAAASSMAPPAGADAPTEEDRGSSTETLHAESGGETEFVIDLTDRLFHLDEPTEDTSTRPASDDALVPVDAVMVGRSWVILDGLEDVIDSGSAVVAVRATGSSYAIVAGVGLAPLEADRLISVDHPIIRDVRRQGWSLVRTEGDDLDSSLPLADCEELLAVAVPGAGGELDAVTLIGRFTSFSDEDVRSALSIVADTARLDDRLRRLQTPAARSAVGVTGDGPFVADSLARAGWQLLDELFPFLGGAAAAVALESHGAVFVPTAAIGVDADVAARFVPADHPLLDRLIERGGMSQVQAANEGYTLVGGLPIPPQPFVVGFRVDGSPHDNGLVLVARQRGFTTDELAVLGEIINGHRFAEVLRHHRET